MRSLSWSLRTPSKVVQKASLGLRVWADTHWRQEPSDGSPSGRQLQLLLTCSYARWPGSGMGKSSGPRPTAQNLLLGVRSGR